MTGAQLLARTVRDGDCLIFTGAVQSRGYGSVGVGGGKTALAHRVSYELNVGPIPPGLQIDHVKDRGCHSRRCINPAHLEPVTPRENVNRTGHGRQTHCKRGHPLSGRNLVIKQRVGRVERNCRTCRDQLKREWDERARHASGERAAS